MSNKSKAAVWSIVINLFLLSTKIVIAILTRSVGLIAESTHSLFDMLASILAYFGIKKAEQPDDFTHHFGHEKFENLSSLIQSLLIAGTAFVIIWEAYQKLLNPTKVDNSIWGIALMLVSIPIAFATAKYLSAIAKKEGGSQALEADSAHFTTDILGSIAVLLGLVAVELGLPIGDALAAIAVGLIMLYISIELGMKSFYVFMDFSPSEEKMNQIESILNSARENKQIYHFHKLKARMAGSKILLEFHIQVAKNLNINTAHKIASDIKLKIKKAVPDVKDATIHIEPHE